MSLRYLMPATNPQAYDQAAALGSIAWLWTHSAAHCHAPLSRFMAQVQPALQHQQFILAYEQEVPVAYAAWAYFDPQAERQYADSAHIQTTDWLSGERCWMIDWLAPFGHTQPVYHHLRQQLAYTCMRWLHFKSSQQRSVIKHMHGCGLSSRQAREYFTQHPILPSQPTAGA